MLLARGEFGRPTKKPTPALSQAFRGFVVPTSQLISAQPSLQTESVFLSGPKPPPPPLSTLSPPSPPPPPRCPPLLPPCVAPPNASVPMGDVVFSGKGSLSNIQSTALIMPQITSCTSTKQSLLLPPNDSSSPFCPCSSFSPYSSPSYQLTDIFTHDFTSLDFSCPSSADKYYDVSPRKVSDCSSTDVTEFLNLDNLTEFHNDISQEYSGEYGIPFLDALINEVRQESVVMEQEMCPLYNYFEDIHTNSPLSLQQTNCHSSSQSECSSSPDSSSSTCSPGSSSISPQQVVDATLVLSPNQSLTIKGENGREYKVVIQAVDEYSPEKVSRGQKRKASSTTEKNGSAPKRAPGISLATLSDVEIAERKKEQNRIAAQKYREKMKELKDDEKREKLRLSSRNAFLREEAIRLEKEIAHMRKAIFHK